MLTYDVAQMQDPNRQPLLKDVMAVEAIFEISAVASGFNVFNDALPPLFNVYPPYRSMWFEHANTLPIKSRTVWVIDTTEKEGDQVFVRAFHITHPPGTVIGPTMGVEFWVDDMGRLFGVEESFEEAVKRFEYYTVKGSVFDYPEIIARQYNEANGTQEPPEVVIANTLRSTAWDLYTTLYAINMLHCNNVDVVDREPPVKVNKKRQKQGKPALVRYKTLTVHGRAGERPSAPQGGHHASPAFHLRRGHFADYRETGLFGKHFGIYWRPATAVGRKERGEIKKIYRVHPTEDDHVD